ncbi:tetratricopeptide repeat protein [Neosynechococcus sphagnicola]|uniref:tetratricopeptide repeat protein n=1 Tax=Neosynechococcus sphagnicola TaxID=1501145 RepID=UPI0012E09D4F|nr:tetratricopeptide repeat protein [Neosynechococcus sphagnicola]
MNPKLPPTDWGHRGKISPKPTHQPLKTTPGHHPIGLLWLQTIFLICFILFGASLAMTCGIYQILNTVNGKSYVGHARQIEQRWQQHTQDLDQVSALETRQYSLRSEFLAYNLRTVVTKAGRHGVFEFYITEVCAPEALLETQSRWIETLKPAYNVTPVVRRQRAPSSPAPKFWIYYHNFEKLGYLPIEPLLYHDKITSEYGKCLSVSVANRGIVTASGQPLYVIVGIGNRPRQYYLWGRFILEEILPSEEPPSLVYHLLADGELLKTPQFLNTPDFQAFKKACGYFRKGAIACGATPFQETLETLAKNHQPVGNTLDFSQLLEHFYAQVLRINPGEAGIYCQQGLLYYQQGQDHRAIQALDQAIQRRPQAAMAYYYRGLAYHQLGQIPQAWSDLQTALDLLKTQEQPSHLTAIVQTLIAELPPLADIHFQG